MSLQCSLQTLSAFKALEWILLFYYFTILRHAFFLSPAVAYTVSPSLTTMFYVSIKACLPGLQTVQRHEKAEWWKHAPVSRLSACVACFCFHNIIQSGKLLAFYMDDREGHNLWWI